MKLLISQANLQATPLLLIRALFKRSQVFDISQKQLALQDFTFNRQQLTRYQDTFQISEQIIPPAFLFVASLNAQLSLLLDKRNKLTVLGLIHRSISFIQFSEMKLDTKYSLVLDIVEERTTAIGIEFEINCCLMLNQACVCQYRSVYLIRGTTKPSRKPSTAHKLLIPSDSDHCLDINEKDARHYASVSKDYNLIHLHKSLSRLFGYKQPIIHGMYLVGHMMPKVQPLNQSVCFTFLRPVLLPNELYYKCSSENTLLVTAEGKRVIEMQVSKK